MKKSSPENNWEYELTPNFKSSLSLEDSPDIIPPPPLPISLQKSIEQGLNKYLIPSE